MKSILPLVIALIATSLILSCTRKGPGKVSEEEDIIRLIETATTPEEHLKIADFYEKQAREMEAKSRSHASMRASYVARGKPLHGLAFHCRNLSKKYREAAEEYKAMAIEHENIAKEIQKQWLLLNH